MTADELLALIETYTDDPNAEPNLWGRIEVEVRRLYEETAHCESCDGSAPECWKDKRQ